MSFIATAVSGAITLGTGIAKTVSANKAAKRQEQQARQLQKESRAQRERENQYQQNMLAQARRQAMSQMPGLSERKEMAEGAASSGLKQINKSARSAIDALSAGARQNQALRGDVQQIGAEAGAFKERAQANVRQAEGEIAQTAGWRAQQDTQRADAVETAAMQNRADAVNALMGGFAGAAGGFLRAGIDSGKFDNFNWWKGGDAKNSSGSYGMADASGDRRTARPISSYKRRGE